jgi:hypothetical protein
MDPDDHVEPDATFTKEVLAGDISPVDQGDLFTAFNDGNANNPNEIQANQPDEDPNGSIYAFLNHVADPYTGPLDACIRDDIEDIYPPPERDPHDLYPALRAHDPQRTRLRHLDLLASAATSALPERRAAVLWRHWARSVPLNLTERYTGEDASLRHLSFMHTFMRQWLGLLYRPCLVPLEWGGDASGPRLVYLRWLAQVTHYLQTVRCSEIHLVGYVLERSPPPLPLEQQPWIERQLRAVELGFRYVAQRFRSAGGRHSDGDGAAALREASDSYGWLPAETRVVAQLLATEKLVERVLARRHVEDEHVARRVRLFLNDECAATAFGDLFPLRESACRFVETQVRAIQHVAQRTAAYRFLKRRRFKRAFKQLFLVIGDSSQVSANSSGDGGLTSALAADAHIVRAVDAHLAPAAGTHDERLLLRPMLPSAPDDDPCLVCRDLFGPEQVVLQPWCGRHLFHLACAFGMWDNESARDGFDCPVCRHPAPPSGQTIGLSSPHPPDDIVGLRLTRRYYARILRRLRDSPNGVLEPHEKAMRLEYYRHRRHNRDRRSFIGFGGRPFDWHPMPLNQLLQEEGLSPDYPPMRYDAATDALVPINPNHQVPIFEINLTDDAGSPGN